VSAKETLFYPSATSRFVLNQAGAVVTGLYEELVRTVGHYNDLIYLITIELFVGYFEVVFCDDLMVSKRYIPHRNASSAISCKKSARVAEFEAVWVHLVKNCSLSTHLLLVYPRILYFTFGTHNQG
jgi:hypothetical protein